MSNNLSSSVYADELSAISVSYTLSDSELLDGEGNLFTDPLFINQSIYNLELDPGSPCVDAGDPDSQLDEDGSNADIGAYYIYDSDDYPFEIPGQLIDQIKINELLVSNDATNVDEAGEFDDWVELYNPTDQALNLSGLYLTDDLDNLNQWQFPDTAIIIMSGGHLLIWCDDDESQGTLHTNFKLSSGGETLALIKPDGTTIIDYISFGSQTTDQSYGRIPDGSDEWGFMSPTPGYSNSGLSILVNNQIPYTYHLFQNYPNPFNPVTKIRYDLPKDALVSITIYDIMGRSIRSLVKSRQTAGYRSIQWNATNNLGQPVSAGIYIYMIQAGEFMEARKLVLLK